MKKNQVFPPVAQFSFENLNIPRFLELQYTLNVFLNNDDLLNNDACLCEVTFLFTPDANQHYELYDIGVEASTVVEQYDVRKLEELVVARLEEIFEGFNLLISLPLGEQLNQLNIQFGDNKPFLLEI